MALRVSATTYPLVLFVLPFFLISPRHYFSSGAGQAQCDGSKEDSNCDGFSAISSPGHLGLCNWRRTFLLKNLPRDGGISTVDVSATVDATKTLNVKDYGAIADGSSDASQAFAKAWDAACASTSDAILMVPSDGSYLLKPVTFSGPCKSSVTFKIQGTIVASPNRSDWNSKNRRRWIEFNGVRNLRMDGGGVVDGSGSAWWQKSCEVDESQPCIDAPTAITFSSCKSLRVDNLSVRNAQQIHVSIERCNGVVVSALSISAPESSPNTDGIHVSGTTNIQITGCTIKTGDDCISIESGTKGLTASNLNCGPGHGISVGSLGDNNSEAEVSDVLVDTAKLTGTTNGVRIKTWQGGRGYARNITFRNIAVSNVKNPIIIDQNYCNSTDPCKQQSSAVAVSNVRYENIKGTSATSTSIKFDCSNAVPCTGISLRDINLGASTRTLCNNVKLSTSGTVVPKPCAGGASGEVLVEGEGPYVGCAAARTAIESTDAGHQPLLVDSI